MSSLLILFNHTLTKDQEFDAKNTLKIHNIIYPSQEIKSLWANIPEGRESLNCYLEDVKEWILNKAKKGDYILIQGDFGATYIMVEYAFNLGLIPIYSTTKRVANAETLEGGEIIISKVFKHVIYRKYERG